jgi:hypothetical protein
MQDDNMLTGKDAEEFIREHGRRLDEERAKQLAEAKAAAVASGKEPFDLAKLETMCDTSSEGRVAPVEERQKRFEEWYYVWYPQIRTLEELARKIDEWNRWSGN